MSNTYKFLFLLLLINVPGFAQVGVGTTTPQYPLDVNGRIRIQYHNRSQEGAGLWFNKPDNTLGTFIGQTPTGHFGIAANASGNWNFVFDHQHTRLGIGTLTPNYPLSFASVVGDKISLWSADATSATAPHYGLGIQGYQFQMYAPTVTDNIVFGIGSSANFTERVRFTGDGNVGIGTDNPTSPLTVKINKALSSGIGLDHISFDGNVRVGTYTASSGGYIQTHSNHPLLFTTNNDQFQAVLSTSGLFGIGTSLDPALAGLVVNKKVGAVNAIFGTNSTGVAIESNFPGLAFNSYYNNGRKAIAPGFGALIGQDPGNGRVYIYSSLASAGAANADMPIAERLSILPNGNVGVGNTNPQAKLDVVGNVKIADGTQGAGKVLTSDADGDATWQKSGFGAVALVITDGYLALTNDVTAILSGAEQLDDDNRWYSSMYITGATAPGYYLIQGSTMADLFGVGDHRYRVQVLVNGVVTRTSGEGRSEGVGANNIQYLAILNTVIKCNAGDIISFRVYAKGSDAVVLRGDPQFTITKL